MKKVVYIVLVSAAVLLVGCGTLRQTPLSTGNWTSVRTRAQVSATWRGQTYDAPITMIGHRDSIAILSYAPFLGIEAARLEATKEGITARIPASNTVLHATYTEASAMFGETVNWRYMQELVSGKNNFRKLKVEYRKIDKTECNKKRY